MAGSIIKLGKNKYKVKLYMGLVNGKRHYHCKTINGNKKTVEQYRNDKLREKYLGDYAEPSKILLSDHIKEWLE